MDLISENHFSETAMTSSKRQSISCSHKMNLVHFSHEKILSIFDQSLMRLIIMNFINMKPLLEHDIWRLKILENKSSSIQGVLFCSLENSTILNLYYLFSYLIFMNSLSSSFKWIVLLLISVGIIIGATNYVWAATIGQKVIAKAKLTCKAGSEPNARWTRCNVCAAGNVSSNGLSCRACRGENIAKTTGKSSCTPCPTWTKANKAHTACIKQRYVSGEREVK